jgi:hypothetical protein
MNKEVPTSDNEMHDLIKPTCEEQGDHYSVTRPKEDEKPYGGWEGHWAGDGSGLSDFDDYNQNEGMDW